MTVVCGSVMNFRQTIPALMIEQIVRVDRVHLDDAACAQYIDFACELADLAAAQILPHFRTSLAVENKRATEGSGSEPTAEFDPVTIADQRAEAVMRERIRAAYPHHGVLGEEHGLHVSDSGLTWVLDPIDGTRAFITGLPLWGCLIALFDGQEPVLGVMDQPWLKERYIGAHAAGFSQSYCLEGERRADHPGATQGNRRTLKTRHCTRLSDAVMMTTSPDMFGTAAERAAFDELSAQVKMQRFGGDCYAYCMLARGMVDLVVEADLQAYDIQALIPIIQAAGGVVSDWHGNSARAGGQVLAAANPALHKLALAALQPAAL